MSSSDTTSPLETSGKPAKPEDLLDSTTEAAEQNSGPTPKSKGDPTSETTGETTGDTTGDPSASSPGKPGSSNTATNPSSISASDWHRKLFSKSLLKQAKLRAIKNILDSTKGLTCLDIGGDNGVVSLHLRDLGGTWHSADINEKAVHSIGSLVGHQNTFLMDGPTLPFPDDSYDLIVIIDMLEHLDDDEGFVRECHRVLKPNGTLVANVPHIKRLSLIRGLRKLLGLTDELHGHVRPGYSEPELYALVKDGFDITDSTSYNKFFVELADTGIQFVGSFLGSNKEDQGTANHSKGNLIDAHDFSRYQKAFRFYNFVYPFLWLAAQFDRLLFFTSGYSLIAKARARPWIPRRDVHLTDGRSISGATMNTKIGTANEFL